MTEAASDHTERLIKLNVGGKKFETCISTLIKYPNTFLGSIFCHADAQIIPTIEYFFDRDHRVFYHVLGYYRTGVLIRPSNIPEDLWNKELEFWKISPSMSDKIFGDIFKVKFEQEKLNDDSTELKRSMQNFLNMLVQTIKSKLLYYMQQPNWTSWSGYGILRLFQNIDTMQGVLQVEKDSKNWENRVSPDLILLLKPSHSCRFVKKHVFETLNLKLGIRKITTNRYRTTINGDNVEFAIAAPPIIELIVLCPNEKENYDYLVPAPENTAQ
eukprot:TRINITY_DN4941_c0_g1_i1.p1 TRINITY_DN4941_c0_g1~~TRINITY_DN4941_c0_g1_i1.p1  ORF type:complete len:271 (+),score=43.40 TRINITY_DN4941_c0_g1_i1:820-1632(+)